MIMGHGTDQDIFLSQTADVNVSTFFFRPNCQFLILQLNWDEKIGAVSENFPSRLVLEFHLALKLGSNIIKVLPDF